MTPSRPIRLYRSPMSGHAHRVELFLSLLGLPFERVDIDMSAGAHKSPAFLAKNAFGQVPVIEDGDVVLADSNAILVYLAIRYDASGTWLPREAVAAAEVQRWFSVAAGQLRYGAAMARFIRTRGGPYDLKTAQALATQLLGIMEQHLDGRTFLLAGELPTVADIALYTYTALIPEAGLSLEGCPRVRAWLARIEALPGFVPMMRLPAQQA